MTGLAPTLLHPREPGERPWKYLLPVLALAFAARAAIALSGDFVLHPDEIMQYLEPAHRLVFGNGVIYWEYFYGARSWLVPWLVAGVLALCNAVGLGQPAWYVGGVKLVFCAVSLLVPAGMYWFGRRHFGDATARVALLAGAFWYELAGFAHKPMTEFVATALLVGLLALCVRPGTDRRVVVWAVAAPAVLVPAIRMHYAPAALILLGLFFLRSGSKIMIVLAVGAVVAAVGVFDAMSWNGGLFHSYVVNIGFNLVAGGLRAGESPPWQFVWWLTFAGAGLNVLVIALALRDPRRYGLLLGLIAVTVLTHSAQAHKEYRFIFAVIPLWLLIGADLVTRLSTRLDARRQARSSPEAAPRRSFATLLPAGAIGAVFAAVSVAGILNALPYQHHVYRGYSRETGIVRFIRSQDPIFAAYRYLARAPGVAAVWQTDRAYFNLPGYYYLHRAIPLYAGDTAPLIFDDPEASEAEAIARAVTHVVSADAALVIPGYAVEREFGGIRVLRRQAGEPAVRLWRDYTPTITGVDRIMSRVDPDSPVPPPDSGVRFIDEAARPPDEETRRPGPAPQV